MQAALELVERLVTAYRSGWQESTEETVSLWRETLPRLEAPTAGPLPVELIEHHVRQLGRKDGKHVVMSDVWRQMSARVASRHRAIA